MNFTGHAASHPSGHCVVDCREESDVRALQSYLQCSVEENFQICHDAAHHDKTAVNSGVPCGASFSGGGVRRSITSITGYILLAKSSIRRMYPTSSCLFVCGAPLAASLRLWNF